MHYYTEQVHRTHTHHVWQSGMSQVDLLAVPYHLYLVFEQPLPALTAGYKQLYVSLQTHIHTSDTTLLRDCVTDSSTVSSLASCHLISYTMKSPFNLFLY